MLLFQAILQAVAVPHIATGTRYAQESVGRTLQQLKCSIAMLHLLQRSPAGHLGVPVAGLALG